MINDIGVEMGAEGIKKVTTSIATSSINNNIHCLISLTKT